jgi:DsbC/DsbD-like thiol-disulfide interchange protein
MSPKLHLPCAAILAVNLVAMVAIFSPARAADASAWDGDQRAAVRLIAGAQRGTGDATIHHAGIEIRLAPGWKTYWRYPGDSGVPPRFDFSGSGNLKSASVRYQAPRRLTDESGTSIGYKNGLVFPLDLTPLDTTKPVVLALKIEYAICEKICIPAEGNAVLTVTGKPGGQDQWLTQSAALVPSPAKIGSAGALAIGAVQRADKRILVDVVAPGGGVELFAEGPTAEWALPVPTPVAGAPAGQQRFAFELDGLPPDTSPAGAELKLTAVAGEQAIEVPYRLD